ncbi:PQ-loop-domain-containing protein [Backusella circina FSU 941]|nr:PQ-loop-domain-containing protein [Backusella circina FSU 941]
MMECVPIDNLPPYIPWIYYIFGSCIYGYRDALSLFFGYLSIFCWLSAHIPQIKENYKLQSADGLSIYLLFFWLASDLGTLLGCFLNHQMFSQILLQLIFIASDVILISQYVYYGKTKRVKEDPILETVLASSDYGSFSKKTTSATALMGFMLFGMPSRWTLANSIVAPSSSSGNAISYGLILAWSCVSLDIAARFPQLFKNLKRHSVEGISNLLFICALAGNFSYGASIALHPGRTEKEFSEAFPYMFGSSCTLFLDLLLYAQYVYYTKRKLQTDSILA